MPFTLSARMPLANVCTGRRHLIDVHDVLGVLGVRNIQPPDDAPYPYMARFGHVTGCIEFRDKLDTSNVESKYRPFFVMLMIMLRRGTDRGVTCVWGVLTDGSTWVFAKRENNFPVGDDDFPAEIRAQQVPLTSTSTSTTVGVRYAMANEGGFKITYFFGMQTRHVGVDVCVDRCMHLCMCGVCGVPGCPAGECMYMCGSVNHSVCDAFDYSIRNERCSPHDRDDTSRVCIPRQA